MKQKTYNDLIILQSRMRRFVTKLGALEREGYDIASRLEELTERAADNE